VLLGLLAPGVFCMRAMIAGGLRTCGTEFPGTRTSAQQLRSPIKKRLNRLLAHVIPAQAAINSIAIDAAF
jgi:hypothetical protein